MIVVNAILLGDPNLSITLTARASLVHALRDWLAPAFKDLVPAHGNTLWFPYRVVLVSMLLSWSIESTLTNAFAAVRRTCRRLFPSWILPRTFTGFSQALRRQSTDLEERLTRHLREQMRLRIVTAGICGGLVGGAMLGVRDRHLRIGDGGGGRVGHGATDVPECGLRVVRGKNALLLNWR